MPTKLASKAQLQGLLDSYDTFLFDCDGVIWEGDHVFEHVPDVLRMLRNAGKRLFFVTNNATKSRQENKAKFDKLGIACEVDQIYSSAYATAAYMKNVLDFPADKRAYVIGEAGLEQELNAVGIAHCGGTSPEDNVLLDLMDFSSITADPSVGAVVCGLDMHINYKKIARACRYLRENDGCLFIATNLDSTFPTHGNVYPGGGTTIAPISYCLGREPLVIGKPEKAMLDSIVETAHIDKSRTIMIGDRLDTDILFGNRGGIATALVLTGVNSLADAESPKAVASPTYILDGLADLAVLAE